MDKSNLELFKQALNEAISNKFDKMAAECTEEITCSEGHKLAMRAIVYGKTDPRRVWSPKMKRIVAILVAAALLLTSCGIIFRNEIREIFEEFFIKLTYSGDDIKGIEIEEIYQLSYVPDGYYLEDKRLLTVNVRYVFLNSVGDKIQFDQYTSSGTDFVVDNESGYTRIIDIQEYEIYYKYTNNNHHYIWNDGKYSMKLKSSEELPLAQITLILDGITNK